MKASYLRVLLMISGSTAIGAPPSIGPLPECKSTYNPPKCILFYNLNRISIITSLNQTGCDQLCNLMRVRFAPDLPTAELIQISVSIAQSLGKMNAFDLGATSTMPCIKPESTVIEDSPDDKIVRAGLEPFIANPTLIYNKSLGLKLSSSTVTDQVTDAALVARLLYLFRKPSTVFNLLHGAFVHHGASSSSLLAFTQGQHFGGRLTPLGQLERQGIVPFGGEIIIGRNKINQDSLSATGLFDLQYALAYSENSKAFQWDAQFSKEISENPPKSAKPGSMLANVYEVEKQRLAYWGRLNSTEQDLVRQNFPVLYGIKPTNYEKLRLVHGQMVPNEILAKDGFSSNEIKVVFVPQDRIERVSNLFKGKFPSISVEPLESLQAEITPEAYREMPRPAGM